MASIKVLYGKTSRKFTVASNTTWSDFESQLRDLFNISNDTPISVSYIDEDADVLTLSTDSELQQILSDQESFGINVKFNINTPNDNTDNNDWVLENAEENDELVATLSDDDDESENVVAYNINENVNQQSAVDYPKVTVTDEKDDPLFEPTVLKEKNPENQKELLVPVDHINEGKDQEISDEKAEKVEKDEKAKDNNQENVQVNNRENSQVDSQESNQVENNQGSSSQENNQVENNQENNQESSSQENNQESENDSNIIFIISSRSPWIQRTYYRPRISLFDSFSSIGYPTHFNRFARPRYSYITTSCSYRRRGCVLNSNRGFGRWII